VKIPLPGYIADQKNLGHSLIMKRLDGIIELRCADVVAYTPEKIKENHEWIKKFADGKKALVLTIAGEYTYVEPEARRYTSQGHHRHFVAAEAFLIRSLPQRVIGMLFLKINRPIVPARLFSIHHKEKAEEWLRLFQQAEVTSG